MLRNMIQATNCWLYESLVEGGKEQTHVEVILCVSLCCFQDHAVSISDSNFWKLKQLSVHLAYKDLLHK